MIIAHRVSWHRMTINVNLNYIALLKPFSLPIVHLYCMFLSCSKIISRKRISDTLCSHVNKHSPLLCEPLTQHFVASELSKHNSFLSHCLSLNVFEYCRSDALCLTRHHASRTIGRVFSSVVKKGSVLPGFASFATLLHRTHSTRRLVSFYHHEHETNPPI